MGKKDKKKVQPLWAGRFAEQAEKTAFDFQASINIDKQMVFEDIEGSRSHVAMLAAQNIISRQEADEIEGALSAIADELKNGALEIDNSCEDIHSFIEAVLTERLGGTGKKVHAGRSRNDQTATDLRLFLKRRIAEVRQSLEKTVQALLDIAEDHLQTIMPGYTHLQRAQPVTLAYTMCAWASALRRDESRFKDALSRLDFCPLGSGAIAGSTLPLDRMAVSLSLGFSAPTINAMDSVADRDFAIELACCCAITQVHLSRFCEDLIIWSTEEFKFVEFSDAWSTGSSIMPQKKNPDFAELIRGKAGRTTGNLVSLLTMLKGLPYAYNKDLQEDKEALFDSLKTVQTCLEMFSGMIGSAKFNMQRMKDACIGGFLEATDAAEYLVKKGLPFRSAHEVAAAIVRDCLQDGQSAITERSLPQLQERSPLFEADIYEKLKPQACVASRSILGGPESAQVASQIKVLRGAHKE